MPKLLQVDHCLVRRAHCHRGMPAGKHGQENERGVLALDKMDFEKQPRSQRVSDRTRADQRRAGRRNLYEFHIHSGPDGKRSILSLQQRDGANYPRRLPIP